MDEGLARAFGDRGGLGEDELERRLRTVLAQARAAWPTVTFDGEALARTFAAHARGREVVLQGSPHAERVAEIALAASCANGDRAAIAAFDARYIATLGVKLASMRLSDAMLDEVKQHVRQKLIVKEGDGALRLEEYAGEGRLEGLVQVMATRAAIEGLRKQRRDPLGEPTEDALGPADDTDPERGALRARYRDDIAASIERAAKALAPRDRSLLRLHLLGGVTLEKLAEMFGVHRATVVRWLARARATMLDETKKELAARLGAHASEVESVLSLVQSRLDISVERILRSETDPGTPG